MTAHNSRKASNSRNESNCRTPNTVGTPTTAGMLAKVMKPATASREDNNNMDTINIRDGSSSSREASNILQARHKQQLKLTTRNGKSSLF
jgi:5,10-methylenetetrahydrofolate reductase